MSPTLATALSLALVLVLLAALHVPLGTYLHHVFTDPAHNRVERALYRLVGVDPDTEQRWGTYALSAVMFGVVSVGALWALVLGQGMLPWAHGRSQDWHTALNTAVSFTTNTNWQSYAGESGAGYVVGMAGLTVQNFVSAATGIAVAIALFRGLARAGSSTIGNFWVDLVRANLRVLLPVSVIGATLLIGAGVVQNLSDPLAVTT